MMMMMVICYVQYQVKSPPRRLHLYMRMMVDDEDEEEYSDDEDEEDYDEYDHSDDHDD